MWSQRARLRTATVLVVGALAMPTGCGSGGSTTAPTTVVGAASTVPLPTRADPATCSADALFAASDTSRPPMDAYDFYVVSFTCSGDLALVAFSRRADNPNGHISEALFRNDGGTWTQLARSGPMLLPADIATTGVTDAALNDLRARLYQRG